MTTPKPRTIFKTRTRPPRSARIVGYIVSALVNLGLIYVVQNILEWGWLPFLTEAFEDLIPITVFSLSLSAVLNLVFIVQDALPFKALGEVVLSAVSLAVIVRTYQVFPFEFASGPWAGLTRAVLILAAVGVVIGIITEMTSVLVGKRDEVEMA